MRKSAMPISVASSMSSIPAAQWNALLSDTNPFTRHEFLAALEEYRCATRSTGWTPHHLTMTDARGSLIGAVPLYRKHHSWGEFVFDWGWANAYARLGLQYYPKLVAAVPFTPAPGTRLLGRDDRTRAALAAALVSQATAQDLSSVHVLFPQDSELAALEDAGFLLRRDCQFHWHNRGYGSFDEFIQTFRADKRKKALRERRRVREAGIQMQILSGAQVSASLWRTVFAFSERTFAVHGNEHYLNAGFLQGIAQRLPQSLLVVLATLHEKPIAAAIFFRSDDTLYGRYWGTSGDYHSLHFETCYYQGIEYCIREGLQRFEPGTQGEHKIARGFEPTYTWSAHWLADSRIRRALQAHLQEEGAAVDSYMNAVREHLPFHRGA
jgi:predicted N-acyltransferase